MGTVAEIQEAIARLSPKEKAALSVWLESQTEPDLTPEEETELLRVLDKAARELDAGKGITVSGARELVGKWASR